MQSMLVKAIVSGMMTVTIVRCAEVIIKTAPPPPVSVAVVGRAPSARHVWIPGYYKGSGGRYVWVPGKWMVPPRRDAVWVPAVWVQRHNGYAYVPGHWR